MRYYAIIGTDTPCSFGNRLAHHAAHLARVNALQEEGRLLFTGSFPAIDSEEISPAGFSGGLIVAKFSSLEAAKQWVDTDPYVIAGVYATVDVKPFKPLSL